MMPAPVPGQLVSVRQRRFVVTDVAAATLHKTRGARVSDAGQHLVSLASIEEDAGGSDGLRVVWEIEPGARVLETAELPSPAAGFDDPARLDAFLDAVRWGAIASVDTSTLQAPFRSGIEIEDYQLDPLVRAIAMPRVNLLIADDVGLGKTIEAGLVAHELLLRYRARTILIVCPSSIQIQWRDQMHAKFGLDFRIVDSELMRELRRTRGLHVNPWRHYPRLITSIDYLKRDRPMRLLREVLGTEVSYPRKIDLLIVDEAHNVAPSGTGKYATDSLRTQAVRTLAPHCEHKLFLSATPHNGYSESFQALLELLDDQRFTRGAAPDRKQLATIMIRRLKSELPPDERTGVRRFPKRDILPLGVRYTDEERQAHAWLQDYARRRLAGVQSQGERFATEFTVKMLKKRLFSSPEAFAVTLERHMISLRTARHRTAGTLVGPTEGVLRRQIEEGEEDFDDDTRYEESLHETVERASLLFRPPDREESAFLESLMSWAQSARGRPDSKAAELIRWLRATLHEPDGRWSERRAIIFTEYRDTQRWLLDLLAAAHLTGRDAGLNSGARTSKAESGMGYGSQRQAAATDNRLLTLYGGMDADEREAIKAAFQTHPQQSPVRILLATDAASEGIDLQNHCSRLIHYEIPWNPNRMEQRNGRIDRHGQRASEVEVFHFVAEGYARNLATFGGSAGGLEADLEFLWRAVQKVDQIREDLGSVGPVIATQVESAMLGRAGNLDTAGAEKASPQRQLLKVEQEIGRRIAELHQRLNQSMTDLHLTPENVLAVVSVGLEVANQPPLIPVKVAAPGQPTIQAYTLPALAGSWARCAEGSAHPHTGVVRPLVFDHRLAVGRDDVVLAHLNHPLVAMCLRLLRAQVWAPAGQQKLARVTARLVPAGASPDIAVVAHARLVLLGGDNTRLHEEVIAAGGMLRNNRFVRFSTLREMDALLAAAGDDPAPEWTQQRLAAQWPTHEEELRQALAVRQQNLINGMTRDLRQREEGELRDIAQVLNELRATIERALRAEGPIQLELFSKGERDQFERNRESLAARAARIPEEIEREQNLIRARFANPTPRLFPVSVTYLVPEGS